MPEEASKAKGRSKDRELRSADLAQLYGFDYFHGVTSGYPSAGYAKAHPDFRPWITLMESLKGQGVLVDIGCAYGYLVREARESGFQAFGFDISHFALTQEPSARSFCSQADAQRIPLPAKSADVILLLDVLEHLLNPLECLDEVDRILKPDGLLVLATPDPLYFDRPESTHFFERPPSFWVHSLFRLGFSVAFRFSEVPYNFQLLACRSNGPLRDRILHFRHDFIGPEPDFIETKGLIGVPRYGWGSLDQGRRPLQESGALYLLNLQPAPLRLAIRMEVHNSGRFSSLRIRLNSLVLQEIKLTSEQDLHKVDLKPVLLPRGGHHLFCDLSPDIEGVCVGSVNVSGTGAPPSDLTLSLPFDVYQRYQLAAEIIRSLEPGSVLDVGGYIGDRFGHLAVSADFFDDSARTVVSSDQRHCDHPTHLPCDALKHPLEDASHDLVVSLDVLEHVPPEHRRSFLVELDRLARRWIVVGAPFDEPGVEVAEALLAETLMRDHSFLSEHRELGLPQLEDLVQFFEKEKAYGLAVYPSGFLPDWLENQSMTQLFFGQRDYAISSAFNRACNEHCFQSDMSSPAYRMLVVIDKRVGSPRAAMGASESGKSRIPPEELADLVARSLRLHQERERALHDVQFLINARQDFIEILQKDREELLGQIRRLNETTLYRLALRRLKRRKRD